MTQATGIARVARHDFVPATTISLWCAECGASKKNIVHTSVPDPVAASVERIRRLHRKVQWQGWRLFVMRAIKREPLAYEDAWCVECRKPWPCPTTVALPAEEVDRG